MVAAFSSSAQDAMFVDSTGNVGIGTNTPETMLEVDSASGSARVQVDNSTAGNALRLMYALKNNGSVRFTMADVSGNNWAFSTGSGGFSISKAGSGPEMLVRNNGNLEISGTLSEGSSRAIKGNVTPLDEELLLEKLQQLSISEWSYQAGSEARHVGPMAEEFYAMFGLGIDDQHIAPKDLAGIALAAAKALNKENERLREVSITTEAEVRELRARLEALEQMIASDNGVRVQ